MRFGGKRPGSAQIQGSPNTALGSRTKSVTTKKGSGPVDRGGGVKSHLEFVRSMDSDSELECIRVRAHLVKSFTSIACTV